MKKSGQITVFLSMILLCIAALLCGLMEAARTAGARCYLRVAADSALDSVMAGYHRELWARYRILLREFDGKEELEDEFSQYFDGYLEAAGWYPAERLSVSADQVTLVTDDGGDHLRQEVLDYMKYGVWTLDFSEDQAGEVLDGIREAGAVQETSRLYGACSAQALELEEAIETIDSIQQSQEELWETGRRQLADRNGRGFLNTGEALLKELGKVPGAVSEYSRRADRLQSQLESVYGEIQEKMEEMTPGMKAAAEEEYGRYQSYTSKDGERRGEIEGLPALAESNGELVKGVMEEAKDVMEYIANWDGDEDEELDEAALWRPVRRHLDGFQARTLTCAHGTADKEKQSFLENIRRMAGEGFLGLVLPEGTPISGDAILEQKLPSEERGEGGSASGLGDRLLTGEYCGQFFRHFLDTEDEPDAGLRYQIEYLAVGGKEDRQNLAEAAARLLAVREGLNLVHILGDGNKRAQARELAAAIVGVSGLLPLVEVVAVLVMGVWALGEALVDVRTLLAGGKVPLIKSGEDWNLSLDQLLELGKTGQAEERQNQKGFSYESYLKLLLFAADQRVLLYRMMDVMQDTIGRIEPGFLMERCAWRVEMSAVTEAAHLFSAAGNSGYRLETNIGRSY